MSLIDASNCDKVKLIRALWRNTGVATFYSLNLVAPPPEPSDEDILNHDPYFDYLKGRPIKTNFEDMSKLDPRLYDRDAGQGVFAKCVAETRS